jgi:signal transduction histidine kinase
VQRRRSLIHLLTGLVLGPVWFTLLVAGWATGIGTAVTIVGLPILWFLLAGVRNVTALEAGLAHALLGADTYAPPKIPGFALRERLRSRALWHAQLYLLYRFFPGLLWQIVVLAPLAQGLGLLVAPAWYWAVPGGIDLGLFQVDTLPVAIAVMPLGAALMGVGVWLAGPYGRFQKRLAERLLHGGAGEVALRRIGPRLQTTVAVCAGLELVGLIVWASTGRTSAWPAWTATGLAVPVLVQLSAHAGNAFRIHAALCAGALGVTIVVWALAGGGYLWPLWVLMGLAVSLGLHALFAGGARTQLARVQQLTRTRAEVVGAQEDELRRIERDLHDGAQARLVSLTMSLGLAEARMDEDPQRARELMAEARSEATAAIRELRDLARGIAPPVLADRGLAAAIEALAATSPLPVVVTGSEGAPRPAAAIERAGYFTAAEALANAAKHAGAGRIDVRLRRNAGRLEVEIADDGRGGANPHGPGLVGLRQRVEAVDGTLTIDSPAGWGTKIRVSLPCASS